VSRTVPRRKTACGPIRQSGPRVTPASITEYGPISQPSGTVTESPTIAVGWIFAMSSTRTSFRPVPKELQLRILDQIVSLQQSDCFSDLAAAAILGHSDPFDPFHENRSK